jgi:translation initiation factor IF-2
MAQKIQIEDMITVGALAEKLNLPATKLIGELFKNGVMVTINEKIDFDTAQIIVSELGLEVGLEEVPQKEDKTTKAKRSTNVSKDALNRPPVVAVMGHVDHGKTSLLDVIRSANVVAKEAGGITQHISAYQVKHEGRLITFLDTPGHEAFAALREHGARLTDVVIIVIAADDGIKPQTLEAIRYTKNAGSKIIVAITKIDKPEANIDRVKQQLSEQKMIPEEWGGDTIIIPISSKTKEGINKLLDMILLVSDIEDLRADIKVPAEGLIVESHMEQGKGATAVALVQKGTININEFVVAGTTYAKVRVLQDSNGQNIKQAGPSTPVIISGFKSLPEIADEFIVIDSEKQAKTIINNKKDTKIRARQDISGSELLRIINQKSNQKELNILVKADVQGSLTSVIDSIKTLDTDDVVSRVVGSGVGAINENDIRMAASSNAIIYGFQVNMPNNIRQLALRDSIIVKLYPIIYELLDDVKLELTNLLEPEVVITPIGRMVIKGIFNTTKSETICGGEITKGVITLPSYADIFRGDEQLAKNIKITNIKRGPTDTKEVQTGELCGISLETENKLDIKEGDKLEIFTREIKERTL